MQAAPQIVDALKNGVDPSEACNTLGLCSSVQDDVVDKIMNGDLNDVSACKHYVRVSMGTYKNYMIFSHIKTRINYRCKKHTVDFTT